MKRLLFTFSLLATVAVGSAFTNFNGMRATTVYGTLNEDAACPSDLPSISCNPTTTSNPVCTNGASQTLFTNNAITGRCTQPLFID